MTETLQDRLRHGAANIHSIGPDRATGLLKEAAIRLEQQTFAESALRDMVLKAHAAAEQAVAAHRAFLERAVCHPGPPASEHEDYDPEADLGELEAAVLERMDLELKAERELRDIRKLCEEALGRTPDPARSTMQVVSDLCAYAEAARTYRANMEDPPAGLEPHETMARPAVHDPGHDRGGHLLPRVRPEHFAGPFPAISGYVKRTEAARAATIDQALRMLKDGQRLAVHDEPERVDILFLDPGQEPPLGQEWTVYGPKGSRDSVTAHILAAGGDPDNATLAQIADAMTATDPDWDYKPNAAGNGLDATPVGRASAGGSIHIVGGDHKAIGALGLEEALEAGRRAVEHMQHPSRLRVEDAVVAFLTPERRATINTPEARKRLQGEIVGFLASLKDTPPPPAVELDHERSDLPNGKIAFKIRVSSELAAAIERQRNGDRHPRLETYRPGSPTPERAPADYHPAEYMTPEQEAEYEDQRERFDHDED